MQSVHTHPRIWVRECVWGPLCFSAYAYLVTLKMVSRLCVRLRELPLYSPCCLFTAHKKLHLSWPHPSGPVSLACSMEDSEDHRASRSLSIRLLSSWEFHWKPAVKSPPFEWRAVRWGLERGKFLRPEVNGSGPRDWWPRGEENHQMLAIIPHKH